MSQQILEHDKQNGIIYRIMTMDDIDATAETMAQSFHAGEPCTAPDGCNWSLNDWRRFVQFFITRMALEGNTILASDDKTNEIAGAFMNEDFSNPPPVEMEGFFATSDGDTRSLMACVDELELHLLESHGGLKSVEELKPGKWLHLWMKGVLPKYRGKGIAKKVAEHSIKWAKSRGFEFSFAETTGAITTHIGKDLLGGKLEYYVDYEKWEFEGKKPFAKVPANGHPGMSLLVFYNDAKD